MGCNGMIPIGEHISFSRGGGWGKEEPFEGSVKVAIIRGADFPALQDGRFQGLPVRYEKAPKVKSVSLRAGDIILENSGGTDNRPTGRTLIVTQALLDSYEFPVITASFCRLLRFDDDVDNTFAYYWLQDMYQAGRTWGYQNRSTGLSNFQYKVFAEKELVSEIPLDKQRKIASVLSSLDRKRIANSRTNGYLAA